MFSVPDSWVACCVSICESLCIPLPGQCGVGLTMCGCGSVLTPTPLTSVSMDVCSRLYPPCRSVMWIPLLPQSNCGPDEVVYRFPRLSHSRFWVLARWGCSIVSLSVPSQISMYNGVVVVLCMRIPSHSGCGIHGCSTPLPVSTAFALSSPMSPSLGTPVSLSGGCCVCHASKVVIAQNDRSCDQSGVVKVCLPDQQ